MSWSRTQIFVLLLFLIGHTTCAEASEPSAKEHQRSCCSSASVAVPGWEGLLSGRVPTFMAMDKSATGSSISVPPLYPLTEALTDGLKVGLTKTAHGAPVFGMVRTTVRVDARRAAQDSTEGFERRI